MPSKIYRNLVLRQLFTHTMCLNTFFRPGPSLSEKNVVWNPVPRVSYYRIFTIGWRSVRFSWGLPWLCFSLSLTLNPIQKYNFCEFSEKIKDQRARALPQSSPVREGWLITDQRLLQLPFLNEKLRALKNWIKYAILRRISTGTSTIGGSSELLNISVCAG